MWKEKWRLLEIFMAELLGTAMLMLFGCMSLVSIQKDASIPSMQPGIIFGATVATIIVIFGHISNAHLNPAVTVAAYTLGLIDYITVVVYVISQCIGACFGYGLLKIVTPEEAFCNGANNSCTLCTTVPHPSLTIGQAFLAEFLATSFLIYTVCGVWDERNKDKADAVPIKFALVVAALSIIVGPYTACSMNPARSLAPAIFSGVWTDHWIYWASPTLAAFVSALFYKAMFYEKKRKGSRSEKPPNNRNETNSMIRSLEDATINTRNDDIHHNFP